MYESGKVAGSDLAPRTFASILISYPAQGGITKIERERPCAFGTMPSVLQLEIRDTPLLSVGIVTAW